MSKDTYLHTIVLTDKQIITASFFLNEATKKSKDSCLEDLSNLFKVIKLSIEEK